MKKERKGLVKEREGKKTDVRYKNWTEITLDCGLLVMIQSRVILFAFVP